MPRVVTAGVPEPDAARHHGALGLERDRVLVHRDPGPVERLLGVLAGQLPRREVDQQQVRVGAAGDQPEAPRQQRLGEGARRWSRSAAGRRATPASAPRGRPPPCAAITCMSGPPCTPGMTVLSSAAAWLARHITMPPRGPRSVLCVVLVTKSASPTGEGCRPAATRPAGCAMSAISVAPTSRAMSANGLEVDGARKRRAAGDDAACGRCSLARSRTWSRSMRSVSRRTP